MNELEKALKKLWNGNEITYKYFELVNQALADYKELKNKYKLCQEYFELTDIVETKDGFDVVFWKDKDYEYAKQLVRKIKGVNYEK